MSVHRPNHAAASSTMRDSLSSSFSQLLGSASDLLGSSSSMMASHITANSRSCRDGGSGNRGVGGSNGSFTGGYNNNNNNNNNNSSSSNSSSNSVKGWRRKTRENAARSKTGLWGPTHSLSSDEEADAEGDSSHLLGPSYDGEEKKLDPSDYLESRRDLSRTSTPPLQQPQSMTKPQDVSHGTPSTKSSQGEEGEEYNDFGEQENCHQEPITAMQYSLGRVWNNLQCTEDTTLLDPKEKDSAARKANDQSGLSTTLNDSNANDSNVNERSIAEYVEEVCPSPCSPTNLNDVIALDDSASTLGISRLLPPGACINIFQSSAKKTRTKTTPNLSIAKSTSRDAKSTATVESAADRRRQRHKRRLAGMNSSGGGGPDDSSTTQEAYEVTPDQVLLVRKEPKPNSASDKKITDSNVTTITSTPPKPLPMESLTLNTQKAVELERSISELTMRSSYGEATAKIAENRRMAYYAVGRHHRQSGRGGNRRCYFTGKLILGGAPFYAGSVQQGLRTLVVFCLPSAVGLPRELSRNTSPRSTGLNGSLSGGSIHSKRPSLTGRSDAASVASRSVGVNGLNKSSASLLSRKGSRLSRLSSVDDTSLSVEEELDPNWELDKEYLLSVLPEPDQNLLDEMALRYPAQFETLPVQVRSPHCWKLYVKFCFFSGLPIAEGEMHYQVRDAVADQYGEEIILSHEVMEAVNGDSAEILRLPNLKTFRYLRKHYHQQSAKLPDSCFQRQAWEMVRPEV